MSEKIKVTLERSINGTSKCQRETVRALGLHKRGSSHVLPNRVEVQGMIRVVQHLVKVEEV
ncbi:50S ribosomal protein L30 [bacterium]|nr:50S ribosomal protein L30 [bacterium]